MRLARPLSAQWLAAGALAWGTLAGRPAHARFVIPPRPPPATIPAVAGVDAAPLVTVPGTPFVREQHRGEGS